MNSESWCPHREWWNRRAIGEARLVKRDRVRCRLVAKGDRVCIRLDRAAATNEMALSEAGGCEIVLSLQVTSYRRHKPQSDPL